MIETLAGQVSARDAGMLYFGPYSTLWESESAMCLRQVSVITSVAVVFLGISDKVSCEVHCIILSSEALTAVSFWDMTLYSVYQTAWGLISEDLNLSCAILFVNKTVCILT
jgi:hypothetical protein